MEKQPNQFIHNSLAYCPDCGKLTPMQRRITYILDDPCHSVTLSDITTIDCKFCDYYHWAPTDQWELSY